MVGLTAVGPYRLSIVGARPNGEDNDRTVAALEHAWKWFELHARQRLQAVDFFLVASAFLTAGFVTAIRMDAPMIALFVGIAGIVFSASFYGLEIRTRELVKAGEDAMRPLQRQLGDLVGVQELELVRFVEQPKGRATYHSVIRAIYVVAIFGFAVGSIYAFLLVV